MDITNITPAEAIEKCSRAKQAFERYARDFAKAHSEYLSIKNLKDSVFYRLAKEQSGETVTERERQAKASDSWKEYLDGLNAAEKESSRLAAEKEISKTGFEFWQTFIYDLNTSRRTNT